MLSRAMWMRSAVRTTATQSSSAVARRRCVCLMGIRARPTRSVAAIAPGSICPFPRRGFARAAPTALAAVTTSSAAQRTAVSTRCARVVAIVIHRGQTVLQRRSAAPTYAVSAPVANPRAVTMCARKACRWRPLASAKVVGPSRTPSRCVHWRCAHRTATIIAAACSGIRRVSSEPSRPAKLFVPRLPTGTCRAAEWIRAELELGGVCVAAHHFAQDVADFLLGAIDTGRVNDGRHQVVGAAGGFANGGQGGVDGVVAPLGLDLR